MILLTRREVSVLVQGLVTFSVYFMPQLLRLECSCGYLSEKRSLWQGFRLIHCNYQVRTRSLGTENFRNGDVLVVSSADG
jgi:hypothetical protein